MKSEKSILIIDDDMGIRDGLSVLLQKYFITGTAASGKEALQTIARGPHDIYIIDLFLGDLSGFDVLQEIKEKHPKSVTIMLTGFGSDDDIAKAKQLGANEFLHKPINFNRLKAVIDKLNSDAYNFEVSSTTLKSMVEMLKGMNMDLFKEIRSIESASQDLVGALGGKEKETASSISESAAKLKMKLTFIETYILLKNSDYTDTKSDLSVKSVAAKSFIKLNDFDVQKRVIIEDKRAFLYSKTFALLMDVLVNMLDIFPQSLLRISKSSHGIQVELINADLKIQQSIDTDDIAENFPSIEISLLKELLKFMGARINFKQEGPYTNLNVMIPLI